MIACERVAFRIWAKLSTVACHQSCLLFQTDGSDLLIAVSLRLTFDFAELKDDVESVKVGHEQLAQDHSGMPTWTSIHCRHNSF